MHLRIILIGLSSLLTGCGIFSIDPPQEWIDVEYENNLNYQIEIKFHPDSTVLNTNALIGTKVLDPSSVWVQTDFVNNEDELRNIQTIVDEYESFTIELYRSDSLVKAWDGRPGNYGDSIHSPFNYDSWEVKSVNDRGPNTVGAVTFTITEEDLK